MIGPPNAFQPNTDDDGGDHMYQLSQEARLERLRGGDDSDLDSDA